MYSSSGIIINKIDRKNLMESDYYTTIELDENFLQKNYLWCVQMSKTQKQKLHQILNNNHIQKYQNVIITHLHKLVLQYLHQTILSIS